MFSLIHVTEGNKQLGLCHLRFLTAMTNWILYCLWRHFSFSFLDILRVFHSSSNSHQIIFKSIKLQKIDLVNAFIHQTKRIHYRRKEKIIAESNKLQCKNNLYISVVDNISNIISACAHSITKELLWKNSFLNLVKFQKH